MTEMKMVTEHGGIEHITLLPGFSRAFVAGDARQNNYLECRAAIADLKICYEEMRTPLCSEARALLEQILADGLSPGVEPRILNLIGTGDASAAGDALLYEALCQCIVCGGRLVRGGSWIDEERSIWAVRMVGAGANRRIAIIAFVKFKEFDGSPSEREAILAMPKAPDESGSFYLWLEGRSPDINDYREAFIDFVIGQGKFRKLPAPMSVQATQ